MASKLTHPPAIIHLNPKHNDKMGIFQDISCLAGFRGGLTVLIEATQPIEPIQGFKKKKKGEKSGTLTILSTLTNNPLKWISPLR